MPDDGRHECPWPGCTRRVQFEVWGCRQHWFALPDQLRTAIARSWRRGDLDGHVTACAEAAAWMAGQTA